MKRFVKFLFLGLFLVSCETYGTSSISTSEWKFPWPQGLNKNQFIESYFKNKSLEKVEGVYSANDNRYEIAVIKNTFGIFAGYDYLGVLTDKSANNSWKVGEVKMVLKKTATPTIFTGNWYMGNYSRIGRTFFLKQGYIEVNLPSGSYGIDSPYLMIKAWPPAGSTRTVSKKKKSKSSSGSAFFIDSKGHLITNYHVVKNCNNNSKIIYKQKEVEAKLISKDKNLDLALLKADISNDNFLIISNKKPKKLQRVIAAGYPFGKYLSDDLKFTSGIISSLKGVEDDTSRLQIDAALNPGNSGGPIVDEESGQLIAVAVAGLRKDLTESINFGIKASSLKSFLNSNQLSTTTLSKKFSNKNLADVLEDSTLYTFCK